MLRKICFLFFQLVFNFKANRRHSQEHSMELPQLHHRESGLNLVGPAPV